MFRSITTVSTMAVGAFAMDSAEPAVVDQQMQQMQQVQQMVAHMSEADQAKFEEMMQMAEGGNMVQMFEKMIPEQLKNMPKMQDMLMNMKNVKAAQKGGSNDALELSMQKMKEDAIKAVQLTPEQLAQMPNEERTELVKAQELILTMPTKQGDEKAIKDWAVKASSVLTAQLANLNNMRKPGVTQGATSADQRDVSLEHYQQQRLVNDELEKKNKAE